MSYPQFKKKFSWFKMKITVEPYEFGTIFKTI